MLLVSGEMTPAESSPFSTWFMAAPGTSWRRNEQNQLFQMDWNHSWSWVEFGGSWLFGTDRALKEHRNIEIFYCNISVLIYMYIHVTCDLDIRRRKLF